MNRQTILLLGALAGIIDTFAYEHQIDWADYGTIPAVKMLTGKGRFPDRKSKKLATMEACWARGWKTTEDEADAIALLLYAEAQLYPRESYQRKMVLKTPKGPLFAVV